MPKTDLNNRFTYHPPQKGQTEKYEDIRSKARELAELIDELCPISRESAIAIRKVEEASMWANASIARNE